MAKIGVQASTLKGEFATLGTFETLRAMTEIGYRAIELSQVAMTAENVAAMRRAQDELGVEIVALSAMLTPPQGFVFDSLTENYDKLVADCRTLGTSLLRIGMLPFEAMASLDLVVDFARTADGFARRLRDDGIDLYYHNHHIEFAKFDGRHMLDIIAETAPSVGLELDVHWIHRGGLDPVAVLARYAGRVRLVHLKDYRIAPFPASALELLAAGDMAGFMAAFTGVVQFAEVGQGNLDWKPIIEQAIASGAEYLLVEQDETYGRDPFTSLSMSREHLVGLGYGDLF
ncbi:MAG TPA: sugar phosphate isomerase/epimerase [Actinotalea sp.]|nr:sugar phosphate isomerase/epimerase [Actinotalea sp.]